MQVFLGKNSNIVPSEFSVFSFQDFEKQALETNSRSLEMEKEASALSNNEKTPLTYGTSIRAKILLEIQHLNEIISKISNGENPKEEALLQSRRQKAITALIKIPIK